MWGDRNDKHIVLYLTFVHVKYVEIEQIVLRG